MKLARDLAPLAFTVLSGAACVPGSNRGPTAAASSDSANDALHESSANVDATEPASGTTGGTSGAPSEAPPPVVASTALSPLPPPRPVVAARLVAPYRVRIVGPSMHDLRTFQHDGRSYVLGTVGERYAVVLSNPTAQRVEAVISIDGLDAIDGSSADYARKRGYILPAHGSATIEGFRTSVDQVATFRFSSVADSYAGRLGQARDVGVIGVAFFPERAPVAIAAVPPSPTIAPPSSYDRDEEPSGSAAPAPRPTRSAPAARKAEAAPAASPPSTGAADLAGRSSSGGVGSSRERAPEERKGLGTEFGEARESRVQETAFTRANAASPSAVLVFRYNDRTGLMALGIRVDPPAIADTELRTRETADPFRANRFALPPP
jgi:hypothetical protein